MFELCFFCKLIFYKLIFSSSSSFYRPNSEDGETQGTKKQSKSSRNKTFKERNPDLDLDEIQRNPNVPDDIKAVLIASTLVSDADEKAKGVQTKGAAKSYGGGDGSSSGNLLENWIPREFKNSQELLAYIDDATGTVIFPIFE